MKTNTTDMNITNQINAALADVRSTLVELSKLPVPPEFLEVQNLRNKARYQMHLAIDMVTDHCYQGFSQPWSDRKHQVMEEFS